MPTLNKLEYLNETKQQIKNSLNTNFNSQIQDTDTFRSYVTKIKDIYNNWSRVIGEDTTLSLTPTRQGKMQIELKPSELSQNEEPSPENPQDIHVITGDNTINIINKNLFDVNKRLTGDINQDGDIYWTARKVPFYEYNFKENTSYTIFGYFKTSGAGNGRLSIVYTDGTSDGSSLNTNNATEYTYKKVVTPSNKTIDYIGTVYGSNGTAYIKKDTLMIAEGDVDNYVPHQEQSLPLTLGSLEYCKIGNYEDDFMIPKNLFDGELELGIINGNTGNNVANDNSIRCKNYIPVEELTNYKAISPDISNNILIYEYKEDFSYNLTTNKIVRQDSYFTTESGTKYIRFRPGQASGLTDINTRFMIKKGIEETEYEIYNPDGKLYLKKKIGKIASYNGETIETNYKSTTGGLDTGATIYYGLTIPQYILLNDTLQSQLEAIYNSSFSYQDQTNISQVNDDLPFVINASALMKGDV